MQDEYEERSAEVYDYKPTREKFNRLTAICLRLLQSAPRIEPKGQEEIAL